MSFGILRSIDSTIPVFCADIALLANEGVEIQTHSGVRQLFGLHFVKTGKIEPESARFLARLFDLCQTVNYDDFVEFDSEKDWNF
jgi:uncharacterized protein (UPF0332 family)